MRREVRSLFYDILNSACLSLGVPPLTEQLKPESDKHMLCGKGTKTPNIDSCLLCKLLNMN